MPFAINFLEKEVPKSWLAKDEEALLAEIVIGDFRERLSIPTKDWPREEYERQWLEAIESLTAGGKKTALVTQFYNPLTSKYHGYVAECWALFRHGQLVFIQNYYETKENLKHFDKVAILANIQERHTNASEWSVSMIDLQEFGNKLKLTHHKLQISE